MSLAPMTTPDFLVRFESQIRSTLHDPRYDEKEPRLLLEASRRLAFAGAAKRMRPLLVDHFGATVELLTVHRLAIATAAELIHTASLLHDDVIDEGRERRGEPTVNAQWNNSVAVLGGDLLLCIALEQLEKLPPSITRSAVELVAEMTRAAMQEVQARHDRDWDLTDWTAIAHGKTGALLSWCGAAPAKSAGRPELATFFANCGRHLGLAFQLTDDLRELVGLQTGKTPYADLRHANPSFPIALARSEDKTLRSMLDDLWNTPTISEDALTEAAAAIIEFGAPQMTLERIEDHLDLALESLADLAHRPGGRQIAEWTVQLRGLARQSMENL